MKARDKMAYGQYLAGIAFNNASLRLCSRHGSSVRRFLQPASRRVQRDPASSCRRV